jgi:uncharacterized protein YcfJ
MRKILILSLALVMAGCASDRVIVDTKGVDMSRYEQDKAECETYASQVSTGEQAGKGAIGGAVVGAAIGAIVGNSTTVGRSAGVGGVLGGARGAAKGEGEKDQVLRNCLRGRGYRVLN